MRSCIIIITGANRGLGLETGRQLARLGHHVILTGRHLRKVQTAVKSLKGEGLGNTEAAALDVTDDTQVRELIQQILHRHSRIDVLVNNAGQAFTNSFLEEQSVLAVRPQTLLAAFNVNSLGAYRLGRAVLPHMNAAGFGRIVNVSSGLGQLADMEGGWPAYRISKTALNAITRLLHAEASANVKVNSVCPGWTRTDMGGPEAERSVEEGAAGIVWAATLSKRGPSGGFFRDGKRIAW